MTKCKWCGKEVVNQNRSVYCSMDCAYNANNLRSNIRRIIQRTQKIYGFEVKNRLEITEQKLNKKFTKKCPVYPKLECVCPECIKDIIRDGHCKCNLFYYNGEKK